MTNKKGQNILIKKASGAEELFVPEKLKQSLSNAGVAKETISSIVKDIENWIYPGITTKKIYDRAFLILQQDKTLSSIRYKLKQAIFNLGSTGYPFEVLIGELFNKMGFHTEVGVIINGKCITHEMDVIATKDSSQHLVECKYHKDQGKIVSIQVPLYVRARVDDIVQMRKNTIEFSNFSFTAWVVTNTRFSPDSMMYSKCSGIKLMSWDYPQGNGLKENLEKYRIYPITVLSNITKTEMEYLLDHDIVTCSQLLNKLMSNEKLNLNAAKQSSLVNELKNICNCN